MAKEKTELQQTKNSFKVIGKVARIDKDGAFREDTANKGKREGDSYRSLRFGVKTSDTNEITVEMFDYEPQEVFLWNSEKKKADSGYRGDRVPFTDWEENQEQYREEGYAVLQTRVGLTYGEDGKLQSKGLPSYVASKEIYEALNNGDSVVVEGEIRYSTYENQQGKEVERKSYIIKKLFKIKEVDFEAENFEEVTYFEQEIVFIDAEIDKKEGKAFVTGRVIDFMKNFHDSQFIVDFTDGNGGYDTGMVKLAEAFAKRFKFGDVLNVFGDTLNRVIVEEVEDEETSEEDDLLASLGGKPKPKHTQDYVSRTYVTEMRINGVDAWDKKVYKEEDFVEDNLLANEKEDLSSELGGKQKKNPFKDVDTGEEMSDEDLPF